MIDKNMVARVAQMFEAMGDLRSLMRLGFENST